MFRPLVIYVTTPPVREQESIIRTIDAVTAVDGINAVALGTPVNRWRLARARRRSIVHAIAGDSLAPAAALARRRGLPLVVSVPRGWRGELPASAALVVAADASDCGEVEAGRLREVAFGKGGDGARAADLEEHWVSLVRSGKPAPQRHPLVGHPTVSVVIVTFDRAELLERALEALEAQSYPRRLTQVCVIDNGSTDGTREMLERWASRRWLQVIRFDVHRPVVEARNAAVAATSGEIIAFTDDDCRPRQHWLRSLVAAFSSDVAIVQGKTVSDPHVDVGPLSRTQVMPAEAGLYETCNIAYRRADFEAVDGFDTQFARVVERNLGRRLGKQPFGEDTELAWRAKAAGSVSRFASDAVVEHHVFPADPPYLLRRALMAAAFPTLVKRLPQLRRELLTFGFLLGSRRVLWWLAVAGTLGALLTPWAWLATLPYLRALVAPRRPRAWRRVRVLPFLVIRDAVESLALIYGSVRARRLVL